MKKEVICISCPKGCRVVVDLKSLRVEGNSCVRGERYAVSEITNPVRIVTTTVKIESEELTVLPVKTKSPIPKELTKKIVEAINKIVVKAPIKVGDVIAKNILDTKVDIIATRSILK